MLGTRPRHGKPRELHTCIRAQQCTCRAVVEDLDTHLASPHAICSAPPAKTIAHCIARCPFAITLHPTRHCIAPLHHAHWQKPEGADHSGRGPFQSPCARAHRAPVSKSRARIDDHPTDHRSVCTPGMARKVRTQPTQNQPSDHSVNQQASSTSRRPEPSVDHRSMRLRNPRHGCEISGRPPAGLRRCLSLPSRHSPQLHLWPSRLFRWHAARQKLTAAPSHPLPHGSGGRSAAVPPAGHWRCRVTAACGLYSCGPD